MKFHEALLTYKSERDRCKAAKVPCALGITMGHRNNFWVTLNENEHFVRNDGTPMPSSFFADPTFYTRNDFNVRAVDPDGYIRNAQGELIMQRQCERWVNVYADERGEIFEKDFRSREEANQQTNTACGVRFLRQLHSVNQYTVKFDEVFPKSKSRLEKPVETFYEPLWKSLA